MHMVQQHAPMCRPSNRKEASHHHWRSCPCAVQQLAAPTAPKVSKTLNPFSDANNKNQVNSLVFQTIYERGNASDLETLVSLAGDAGLSPAEVRAYLRSREGVGDVLRNDRRAKTELNVRGVPLFVVRAAAGPEAAESSSASGAADVGASVGGKGRSTEIVLKGAVGADELLRAFAAVSRGT